MHTSNLSRQESIKRLQDHLIQNPHKVGGVAINFCEHNLRLAHENRKFKLQNEILKTELIQLSVNKKQSPQLPHFLSSS